MTVRLKLDGSGHALMGARSLDTVATPWKSDAAYAAYVQAQTAKTQAMRGRIASHRVTNLIGNLVRADRRPPFSRSVLCVGCRTTHELAVFHAAGFGPIVGIDLVSPTAAILPMDMHALDFPESMFDVVFACHSLEHAYDVDVVLQEWARVTRSDGTWAIEVPIRFTPGETDRVDVGSIEGLRARCAPYLKQVLFAEESADGTVARLIGQVR